VERNSNKSSSLRREFKNRTLVRQRDAAPSGNPQSKAKIKLRHPPDTRMRISLKRLRPFIYRAYKLDYKALKQIVARQSIDSVSVKHVRAEELWAD